MISVAARRRWSRVVTRHLNTVLLAAFFVYAYRDLFPLATYTQRPADRSEGWILWAKIAALTFTAVYLPLTIPRQYTPFDAEVRG